eukprot:3334205-Pyramimonas_sp.AAC.2
MSSSSNADSSSAGEDEPQTTAHYFVPQNNDSTTRQLCILHDAARCAQLVCISLIFLAVPLVPFVILYFVFNMHGGTVHTHERLGA